MKKSIWSTILSVFALLILANDSLFCQGNTQIGIGDAIEKALANRPELKAFDQRQIMADKEWKANQLRYIPQVAAGVDLKYNAILATSIVPIGALNPGNPTDEVVAVRFGTNWANGAGLTLSQVVYDPTIRGGRDLATLNSEIATAQKGQRTEAIIVAVAQAYYALLVCEAEMNYAKSDSALACRKIEDVRARLNNDRALPTDVEAAVLDSASVQLRIADIRRNAADWRAQLAYQMGIGAENGSSLMPMDSLLPLLDRYHKALVGATLIPAVSPTTQIQELQIRQTAILQTNEKAGFKPSLMLNGFLGANHYSDKFDPWNGNKWFPSSYIGLSLNVPLTEGFIRQQRIQRLDANVKAGQLDRDAMRDQTDLEFERAKIALQAAEAGLEMQGKMLDLAQKRLALAESRVAQERALQTDVIQAQNQTQSARFQYLRRAYDLLLADLEMRRVCGMLKF